MIKVGQKYSKSSWSMSIVSVDVEEDLVYYRANRKEDGPIFSTMVYKYDGIKELEQALKEGKYCCTEIDDEEIL